MKSKANDFKNQSTKTSESSALSDLLKNLLTPDQIKILYRGSFTVRQAALYMGKSYEFVNLLVKQGKLGTFDNSIPRFECDRYMRNEMRYSHENKSTHLKLIAEG